METITHSSLHLTRFFTLLVTSPHLSLYLTRHFTSLLLLLSSYFTLVTSILIPNTLPNAYHPHLSPHHHPPPPSTQLTASRACPPAPPALAAASAGSCQTALVSNVHPRLHHTYRVLGHRIDKVHAALQSLVLRDALRKPRLDGVGERRRGFVCILRHNVRPGRFVAVAICVSKVTRRR